MSEITRDEAFALLKKYNKDPLHIQHALTVEAVMKWYARELGYGAEEGHWGIVGLLHDIDFELYPSEHCLKAPKMLRSQTITTLKIRATRSTRSSYPPRKPRGGLARSSSSVSRSAAKESAPTSCVPTERA